jgi:ABC-2 type transport system permease protein
VGTDVATDIQGGFFDRLATSPVNRPAILIGRMAGNAALGAFQASLFITAFLLFGGTLGGGAITIPILIVAATLLSLAAGSLSVCIALKTGSPEAVQAAFPIFFVLLFFSSAFFPLDQMTAWFEPIARLNPLTYAINPIRALILDPFDWKTALEAVGASAALAVAGVAGASWVFHKRGYHT